MITPFHDVTAIAISGSDRAKWLNNLITNDIRKLSDQSSVEAFVTDVKGRTLAHGNFFAVDNEICFVSWGSHQAERLMGHWDRYIIREDVTLRDISTAYRWWLTAGPFSRPTSTSDITSVACSALADDGCLVFSPNDTNADVLGSIAHADSLLAGGEVHYRRIVQRWPIVNIDFHDKVLPQELDRDSSAISFTKGCYLGQETVARLDALGQVQKKLVRLQLVDGDLSILESLPFGKAIEPSVKLTDGVEEVGWLTSWQRSFSDDAWALMGYVKRSHFAARQRLKCFNAELEVG